MQSVKFLVILYLVIFEKNVNSQNENEFPKLGITLTSLVGNELFLLKNIQDLPKSPKFNKTQPTAVFCYGYTSYFQHDPVLKLMKAYQKRGGHNFLVLEWDDYNTAEYFSVKKKLNEIASTFAESIYQLHLNSSIKLSSWRLIGHSLGAHMMGYLSRHIQEISDGKVKMKHLTAIDPAGPGFRDLFDYLIYRPLRKTDGKQFTLILFKNHRIT